MTLLKQIKKLENELEEYVNKNFTKKNLLQTKTYKELDSTIKELSYQYNCLLGAYWNKEKWVYDYYCEILDNAPTTLKGNELTEFVANELNKLDGVIIEKFEDEDTTHYTINVCTRYYIYSYGLTRGYGKQCGFSKGAKIKAMQKRIENNYWELMFDLKDLSVEEMQEIIKKYNYKANQYIKENYANNVIEKQLKKL